MTRTRHRPARAPPPHRRCTIHRHPQASLAARVDKSDAHFDSRVFSVPTIDKLVEYMRWRALMDCRRNSISMLAQATDPPACATPPLRSRVGSDLAGYHATCRGRCTSRRSGCMASTLRLCSEC